VCAGRDRNEFWKRSLAALATEVARSDNSKGGMRSEGGLLCCQSQSIEEVGVCRELEDARARPDLTAALAMTAAQRRQDTPTFQNITGQLTIPKTANQRFILEHLKNLTRNLLVYSVSSTFIPALPPF
jgi:hypothetical protein